MCAFQIERELGLAERSHPSQEGTCTLSALPGALGQEKNHLFEGEKPLPCHYPVYPRTPKQVSKRLLFSVSRDARAPQMRNSGKHLARILDKKKVLRAHSQNIHVPWK